MGAIAGVIYPDLMPVSGAAKLALQVLEARCDDPPSTYLFKNVELGVRGQRVAFDDHHAIALIVDGEILNQREITAELCQAGFQTNHLTLPQLLVRAYEHWGRAFAEKLDGAFAIALYDQHKRRLLLLRDRLGAKPLYWAHRGGHFIFASELKALLATGLVPQAPARDALGAYLYLGYIPQDLSPIEGVNKLLPGYSLRYSTRGGIAVDNYWSLADHLLAHTDIPPAERIPHLDSLLKQAIARQTPPDGQLGYLASGSAGSAIVASHLAPERTTALSLEFVDGNPEETAVAGQVATSLGIKQQSFTLSPANLLDDLVRVVWQLDEPIADPASLAIWRLCKQSAPSIDTLFCDVGSQEILAGQGRFHQSLSSHQPSRPWGNFLVPLLMKLQPHLGLQMLRHTSLDPWFLEQINRQALFPPDTLKVISPELAAGFSPDVYLQRFHNLSHLGMEPSTYLYFEIRTHLADKLLLEYDRLTTPHGLSWRSPFLDNNVVNFLTSLHMEEERPLERLLPSQFKFTQPRPLSTFLSPYLHDAAVRRALEYLQHGTLVEAGWISKKWLKSALFGHTKPPVTFSQLWSLLTLEIWFRLTINSPISLTPPDIPVISFLRRE